MYDIFNEPVEIRLSRAKNKKTDTETLDALSHDSFWFVRNFVATNPSTSLETLHYLLQDDDFRVRFEANKNLKKRGLDGRIAQAMKNKDLMNTVIFDRDNQDLSDKEI